MAVQPSSVAPESLNEGHISDRFINGAVWMLVSKLSERGLGLISTLILARLLIPADFGLVAMAAPVVALVELLGAFGIDSALIQKRNLTRNHLDTAFTLNLIAAAAITVSLWLVAPLAARYFREPRLEAVINWLALGNLIQGFGNPGIILFRKEINMAPEVLILIGKKITSLITAATAALLLGNYWALVWGMLLSRFVGVGLSYMLTPFRPRFSLAERNEILGFSSWMLIIQILYYLQLRANDLIIGRLLGPALLAFYSVAMDLAATAPGEAMVAISRAAFPTLSKLNGDAQRLRRGLRQILSGVGLFAIPAAFGIAATSHLLVIVLLGPRWMPVAELLGPLAISCAVLGIMSQISYVYMAQGLPRTSALVSVLGVIALIGSSIILIPAHGLSGIKIAYPLMAATISVGHVVSLRRTLPEFLLADWIAAFWRPIGAASAMFVSVKAAAEWITPVHSSVAGMAPLVGLVAMGVLSYGLSLTFLWHIAGSPDGPEALAFGKIKATASRLTSLLEK
ncbi:MAG TPA: lipopolysaccharide biosynthesis protein [Rhodocyclaceae bacterium]|nr:lipopolysaccharide biosynthesis protein [Rhodocyclaceae bacterium]HUY02648.1 lipopolysaccharide biosynthesis protein [Rhodocyclaceae bacterium]